MDTQSSLFRKEALDHASLSDRLDSMMPVTSPLGWLALLAVAVLLTLITVWSCIGTVPYRVFGQGLILRNSGYGIMDVVAPGSGNITELHKSDGDTVREGEVIGTIGQPELAEELSGLKQSLDLLVHQDQEQKRTEADRTLEVNQDLGGQTTAAERVGLHSQLYDLKTEAFTRAQHIDDLREQTRQLSLRLEHESKIVSQHSGRVTEVFVDTGNEVRTGTRILALESLTGNIEVLGYIAAEDGKRITPGMTAFVAPTTVKPEEFGYIVGTVTHVSSLPVSTDQLMRRLRNEKLVDVLAGRGTPLEVIVRLQLDKNTLSGFRWTSSEGPPIKVESGTICSLSIVTEKRKPISLLLPYLKKQLGLY